MATLVVAGIVAGVGAPTTFVGGVIVASAAIGAAYIDQRYVYPQLFPQDKPQQPNTIGIDEMTGDDGAPGHRSWGSQAIVGGHVLWFEHDPLFDVILNQTTSKKTGTQQESIKRIADIGIGWTRNLITNVEQIFADQKVLWRRDPNNVFWSDYRATVTALTSPARLHIEPTSGNSQDFSPIFAVGDVVNLTNMLTAPNGLWRVQSVSGQGPGGFFGSLDLTPIQSQN